MYCSKSMPRCKLFYVPTNEINNSFRSNIRWNLVRLLMQLLSDCGNVTVQNSVRHAVAHMQPHSARK